jgi:hypothetical protein
MHKILSNWILILSAINLIYGTTFYVSPTGSDVADCTSLTNPCKTVDHVLINLVNNTNGLHHLRVEFGTYILTHGNAFDSDEGDYVNFILDITANMDSPSLVDPSDINTYPVIEADLTDPDHDVAIHLGLGCSVYFTRIFFTNEVKDHGGFFQCFVKFI